jgi:hypothetical protein
MLVTLLTVCISSSLSPGGNEDGRAIETPFGVIYSTNITPDPATGIGAWSYPAFEHAMREGIHRDGRHLYPTCTAPFRTISSG